MGSYTNVPAVLERLRPAIHLGVTTVENLTQRLGKQVQLAPPFVEEPASGSLAAAVDATIAPTRDGGKEVRCGVVYRPDRNASRTPAAEAGLRKEYLGTFASRESLVAFRGAPAPGTSRGAAAPRRPGTPA